MRKRVLHKQRKKLARDNVEARGLLATLPGLRQVNAG
tara:strand:+ start:905 stop:1015 length:111 start_codon:yes stop_codon:yes gene_type:complete